jgi:hypothetical protein
MARLRYEDGTGPYGGGDPLAAGFTGADALAAGSDAFGAGLAGADALAAGSDALGAGLAGGGFAGADTLAAGAATDALRAGSSLPDALAAPALGDPLARGDAVGRDPLARYADATVTGGPARTDRTDRTGRRAVPSPEPRGAAAGPGAPGRPDDQPAPRTRRGSPARGRGAQSGRPGYDRGRSGALPAAGARRGGPPPDVRPRGNAGDPRRSGLSWEDLNRRGQQSPRGPRYGGPSPDSGGRPQRLAPGRGTPARPTGTVPWATQQSSGWDGFFAAGPGGRGGAGGPMRSRPESGADIARAVLDVFLRSLGGRNR